MFSEMPQIDTFLMQCLTSHGKQQSYNVNYYKPDIIYIGMTWNHMQSQSQVKNKLLF